ncbi:hypothetical protein AB0G05_26765 [Nonomuraea wenchangensis]
MEWFLNKQEPRWRKDSTPSATTATARPRNRRARHEDLDEQLREFGVPRPRREALRRGTPERKNRPVNKGQAIQRLEFYLRQRVQDWTKTDLRLEEVAAEWAELVHHDVDQANKLWNDGVDPLRVRELKMLAENGISFRDLKVTVHGKTIMRHLADGQRPEWCIQAVQWERRDRSTL